MATRWRFGHAREDADDGSDFIVPVTDETPWHCDDCGQLNSPSQHGGEWPTCVFCGHPREDWEAV